MLKSNNLGQVADTLLTDLFSSLKLQPFAVIEISVIFNLTLTNMCGLQVQCVYGCADEGEIPKKRSRKSRVRAGRDKEYDSDRGGYDHKSSRKVKKSQLKGMLVVDDGDEDFYQARMR